MTTIVIGTERVSGRRAFVRDAKDELWQLDDVLDFSTRTARKEIKHVGDDDEAERAVGQVATVLNDFVERFP